MKTYIVTEKDIATEVSANSLEKAAAIYFGVEKPVKSMGFKNEYANMRYSKTNAPLWRGAKIVIK